MSAIPASLGARSFERLFFQLQRKLIAFFRKRGFDFQESEDLTQIVFARAYGGLETFRQESSVESWVFSLAWNVWRNQWRSRQTLKRAGLTVSIDVPRSSDQSSLEPPPDAAPSALEAVLDGERRRALHRGVDELPPQMRRCLCHYVYDEWPYHQIADELGVSLNTVKSTICQAKKRLQANLRGSTPEFFGMEAEN